MEVCGVAEEHTGHGDGGRRRAKRRYRNAQLESPHQFLQDENGAGDRRVESSGQACPGACGKQHSAVGPAASKFLADQMPDGRRHLDGRAFAAERQPRTDRQHPCNEFHRYDAKRRLRQFLVQHRLDVWDAAP